MPASGGATVPSPGTNLARISERAPCFEKIPSVRRTHESGSSEILHNNCNTLIPRSRPSRYQIESATMHAKTASSSELKKLNLPAPASAPAASSKGREGTGSPSGPATTKAGRPGIRDGEGNPVGLGWAEFTPL